MTKEIKRKSSFGTVRVDHFSPPVKPETPTAINIVVGFEDALKLQIGLQAILLKMNSYDRSTKDGKTAAVNLCVFTDEKRITINEDKVASAPIIAKKSSSEESLSDLYKRYEAEVKGAGLEPNTEGTYLVHARNFVRWVSGEFKPGSRKR